MSVIHVSIIKEDVINNQIIQIIQKNYITKKYTPPNYKLEILVNYTTKRKRFNGIMIADRLEDIERYLNSDKFKNDCIGEGLIKLGQRPYILNELGNFIKLD